MRDLFFEPKFSVESQNKNRKEYKFSRVIIRSNMDDVATNNYFDESTICGSTSVNTNDFKVALSLRYPIFKENMVSAITETTIESGIHYYFEDVFNEYYMDNQYMAIQMLQYFLRDYYTEIGKVKAVLHIVSHYNYEQLGREFVYPVLSLVSHNNKGIKKFALKVFDNWDSVETFNLLSGTENPKEKWLKEYKERITMRLERKMNNAIFFTSH